MPTEEFQIRAWCSDDAHAQVLVHSSPAGEIRKPITVACDLERLGDLRAFLEEPRWFLDADRQERLVELGQALAEVLLPRPVHALLNSSLDQLANDTILRMRLCLDEDLIGLPWEYLYRPGLELGNESAGSAPAPLTGFLLFDPRISLVREAPRTIQTLPGVAKTQRMLFVGALWTAAGQTEDRFSVRAEYDSLSAALAPVADLVNLDFLAASGDIGQALAEPTAILHYSGHTDALNGSGFLVRTMAVDEEGNLDLQPRDRMYSTELADLLRRARTRLAVFSACYSGRWAFVEPLLRAGVPAVVGVQGNLSVHGAQVFCEALYQKLMVGLSLDEALIGARFHVLKEGGFEGRESMEWGQFMAYLPSTEAVLFARRARAVAGLRITARESSEAVIADVAERLGEASGAPSINRTTLRKAIVKGFSPDELEVLCQDVRQSLADDGVELDLDLDSIGGRDLPKETLAQRLIDHLYRRGYLSYLVAQVRAERPGSLP